MRAELALNRLSNLLTLLTKIQGENNHWRRSSIASIGGRLTEVIKATGWGFSYHLRKVVKGEARFAPSLLEVPASELPIMARGTRPAFAENISEEEYALNMRTIAEHVAGLRDIGPKLADGFIQGGLTMGSEESVRVARWLYDGLRERPEPLSRPYQLGELTANLALRYHQPGLTCGIRDCPVGEVVVRGERLVGNATRGGHAPEDWLQATILLGTVPPDRTDLLSETAERLKGLDRAALVRAFQVNASVSSGAKKADVTGLSASLAAAMGNTAESDRYHLARLEIAIDPGRTGPSSSPTLLISGRYQVPHGPEASFSYQLHTYRTNHSGEVVWIRTAHGVFSLAEINGRILPLPHQEQLLQAHLQRVLPFLAELGFTQLNEFRVTTQSHEEHREEHTLPKIYPDGVDFSGLRMMYERLGIRQGYRGDRPSFDCGTESPDWSLLFNRLPEWGDFDEITLQSLHFLIRASDAERLERNVGTFSDFVPTLRSMAIDPGFHGRFLAEVVNNVFADPPTDTSDPRYILVRNIYRLIRRLEDHEPNSLLLHGFYAHLEPDYYPDEMHIPLQGAA